MNRKLQEERPPDCQFVILPIDDVAFLVRTLQELTHGTSKEQEQVQSIIERLTMLSKKT